ncbi:Rha family transcriptional regulator [Desulfitobacterium chlororespirans]|uniref:Rha family transcriptional regulator n=1 Tax=Desulfitobacterium chlororespirans TaxID=51616 RepID=UPI001FA8D321|nr:Rha family transcriptional regulator [Desulfitobacterium chlororespirans]
MKKRLIDRRMSNSEFCKKYNIPMNRFSEILYGSRPGNKYRDRIAALLGIEEAA